MNKDTISYNEYNNFCNMAMYPYAGIAGCDLIDIHKYLKNKKVNNYTKIKNAGDSFLYLILSRQFYYPFYEKADKDFLSSNYVSSEMKNNIYELVKYKCSDEVSELLNDDRVFNSYSSNEIDSIYKELISKSKKHIFERMALDDYLFFLDGEGPVEFIKLNNSESHLALLMLLRSAIDTSIYNVSNEMDESYFNDKNLLSVYDKFNKYMPNNKEEYFEFVNRINYLTQNNFVDNYMTFINNDFNSNMLYTEKNDWYNRLDKEQQRMKDIINDNMHINFNLGVSARENVLKLKQF